MTDCRSKILGHQGNPPSRASPSREQARTSDAPPYHMKQNAISKELDRIRDIVCDAYGISVKQFNSPKRIQEYAYARFHFWHILYRTHGMGLSQMGRQSGYTHGTVLNGVKKIEQCLFEGSRSFRLRHSSICEGLKTGEYNARYSRMGARV